MWPSWSSRQVALRASLINHSNNVLKLPGISKSAAADTLALQLVASLRREAYYRSVQLKTIDAQRADPNSTHFDAERAVTFHMQNRNFDEACWLIFLMTHFAKPSDSGWLRLRDVYGKLGAGIWDWKTTSKAPRAFSKWLAANEANIRGKFGNHRKYESLRDDSDRGTAKVIESYIGWIGSAGHSAKFNKLVLKSGNDPHSIFDAFYRDLDVISFGRLAKFDYLSLIGRYSIAPIDAGKAYLQGATGPTRGARLLFDGDPKGPTSLTALQSMLDKLDQDLKVSMKVLEDALCNWQKSPSKFVHFVG